MPRSSDDSDTENEAELSGVEVRVDGSTIWVGSRGWVMQEVGQKKPGFSQVRLCREEQWKKHRSGGGCVSFIALEDNGTRWCGETCDRWGRDEVGVIDAAKRTLVTACGESERCGGHRTTAVAGNGFVAFMLPTTPPWFDFFLVFDYPDEVEPGCD